MNKMILFFVGSIIMQSAFARYPGIRTVRNRDAKIITIVNITNDTIYIRLKPTYVHASCSSCIEKSKVAVNHVDDCCSHIKTVEYAIPSQTTQSILLDKIRVSIPEDDEEYLDFTQITYAKIYNSKHKHYRYITISNKKTYVISFIEKSIIIH
jgi:queuine/archaeosine tRNA-ribosyltransferase